MRRGRELKFGVYVKWAEVGYSYKFKRCVLHLFFFFFFEFLPESAVSAVLADMARVGPIPRESARVGAMLTPVDARRLKKIENHVARHGRTRLDVRAVASLTRHRVPPHRTWVQHLWCRIRAS